MCRVSVFFGGGGWLMFQACKRIGLLGMLGSLALVGCGGAADVQSDADPAQSLAERAGAPLFEGMGEYNI